MSADKIELHGREKRRGPVFSKDIYERLSELILSAINSHPEGAIEIQDLIEGVSRKINSEHQSILPWHVLQVKIDLQERGVIKICHERRRIQTVAISPGKIKKRWAII